jgi:hypothetical protein
MDLLISHDHRDRRVVAEGRDLAAVEGRCVAAKAVAVGPVGDEADPASLAGDGGVDVGTRLQDDDPAVRRIGGGTLAGTALGSIIPGLGNVIGAIIGAFIGWLLGFLQDDIVGSRTSALRLHSVAKSYYEKLNLTKATGMPVTLDFKGDGGHYKVTGGWRLINP